jgi:hypothetical protein
VNVDLADTVMVAVHVHGNHTVIVIRPVDGSSAPLVTVLMKGSTRDRQREPITITVSFPCTCTATITVSTTSTDRAVNVFPNAVCRR